MKSILLVIMLSFSANVLSQEAESAPEKRAQTAVEKFKAAMEERKLKKEKEQ